jgi:hypothetical protein
MFQLHNKTIWILSPQPWGIMRVSKHHYATTLATSGNRVFFIEPPTLRQKGIKIKVSEENDKLFIVTYRPVYRGKRFLPRFLYNMLIHRQISLLKRAIANRPDVVWCFDPYRFVNLKWFGAQKTILHVMDLFLQKELPPETENACVCIGVSDTIVKWLCKSGKTVHFINHGLAREFEDKAKLTLKGHTRLNQRVSPSQLSVGYAGNLRMEALNRNVMMEVINKHPAIRFVFWGNYGAENNNLGGVVNAEADYFISFLKAAPNVELRGPKKTRELQNEIEAIDLFWLCWNKDTSRMWDGSNSHKLLEYLSTGKPVISHSISTYKGSDLLYMLPEGCDYAVYFSSIIEKLKMGEPEELKQKRICYALENTYQKQIDRIEGVINSGGKSKIAEVQ